MVFLNNALIGFYEKSQIFFFFFGVFPHSIEDTLFLSILKHDTETS